MRDIHMMMIRLGLALLIALALGSLLSSRSGLEALSGLDSQFVPPPPPGFAADDPVEAS